MVVAIEKDLLNDCFADKNFICNLSIKDKITFNKDNIYFFGNYCEDKLEYIKNKLIKNRKNIKRAIENNIKFVVTGNSYDIFNNSFKHDDLNIFTAYNKKMFKKKISKIRIKKDKDNLNLKTVYSLEKGVNSKNFKYKNLLCIKSPNTINKIIKKRQSKFTLLH